MSKKDIFDIVYYGDKRLTSENKKIEEIDNEIEQIAKKMIYTMKEYQGIGLAGPQVGINKEILVIDVSFGQKGKEEEYMILINPEIVNYSNKTNIMEEGCLSFPELYIKVERSNKIKVEAKTLKGEDISFEAEEFLARVLQHEIDHVKGVVFIERISPQKKMEISDKLADIKKKAKVV